jgi:dipeptidyl aminopeptidase/acylaminoacyl peptidase
MSTELDLGGVHQTHDPDPAFVAALEQRLEAILAARAPSDDPPVGDDMLIDLEPSVRAVRPPRRRLLVRAALGTAAAAAFIVAVAEVVQRGEDPAVEPTITVDEPPTPARQNGWFAASVLEGSESGTGDDDVYLLREDEPPRRVVVPGSDTAHETCPAFAPDGVRLMFGRATGNEDDGFRDAELVVVTVADDGSVAPQTTIRLEGMPGAPCAIWAPDGRWVAFGGASADNEDGTDGVWVVDTVTGEIRRLPGYHPSDLEWRPGTDELAITGDRRVNEGEGAPIDIYTVSTGDIRTVGDVQAFLLTWSPDGTTIAFTHGENEPDTGIWLVDADGTNQRQLTTITGAVNHGIGVVWSPRGDRIAYQRICCRGSEEHEVVLVTATDDDPANPIGTETVIPPPQTGSEDLPDVWFPFSVIWTRDGTHLLYTAWTFGPSGTGEIAVPIDPDEPPIVLSGDLGSVPYGGYPWIPLQSVAGTGPFGEPQPSPEPAPPSSASPSSAFPNSASPTAPAPSGAGSDEAAASSPDEPDGTSGSR